MTSDQCITCKHYTFNITCEAFPEGIPEAIITGEVDHRKPHEGDNGIQWEPADGVEDIEED